MENSVKKMRPQLVSEWSDRNMPYTPENTSYGSNRLVWWHGNCGHEWQTSVKARSKGESCPICSGARIVEGINDLMTKEPEIASEWSVKNYPLKPSMVGFGSHKKVMWKGKCGHEWAATVKSRVERGTGCPYCSHNLVMPGFNDLESRFPEIAREWSERNHPLTPDKVTAFSNRRVWWKCNVGHEWYALISTRSGGSRCPYCSGTKLLEGFNDLATTKPELAKEWSDRNIPLLPSMVNEKSPLYVWWKCRICGNDYKAVVKARVKGLKCPVCSDRSVLKGYNDLATTDPNLMPEWDYDKNHKVNPTAVSRNSMVQAWWKCKAGHSWKAKISDRTIGEKYCGVCEAAFQNALSQLLIMYYAKLCGVKALINNEDVIGIRLDTFFPQLKMAIEMDGSTADEKKEQKVKAYICEKNNIKYFRLNSQMSDVQIAKSIKAAFQKCHCFLNSSEETDVKLMRQKYMEWMKLK